MVSPATASTPTYKSNAKTPNHKCGNWKILIFAFSPDSNASIASASTFGKGAFLIKYLIKIKQ